jgi:hypothetical protein
MLRKLEQVPAREVEITTQISHVFLYPSKGKASVFVSQTRDDATILLPPEEFVGADAEAIFAGGIPAAWEAVLARRAAVAKAVSDEAKKPKRERKPVPGAKLAEALAGFEAVEVARG